MERMQAISPEDFVEKLNNNELEHSAIIDVREPVEWDYYHLNEAQLIPMQSIPTRLEELPKDRDLYIVCAHGVRSTHVCYFLREQGFNNVINVNGGMAAVAMLLGFQYD
ncbi:rhodanese-like domain-containing protein [Paenibacillus xerothermodurans]|uniref:Rhodanese-like domain-containing protein n=1 Tax=Paenibacillus xerothermodurans TaxID=1977292 RepID=A0A2W1NW71_PAEXE|nr:rhodanese-like domain-containing protein [Paenibacillus xerothermodurans]PZE21976.1 rhodanese-like domain-containing protein [Paenibacillus xerothermodurans]